MAMWNLQSMFCCQLLFTISLGVSRLSHSYVCLVVECQWAKFKINEPSSKGGYCFRWEAVGVKRVWKGAATFNIDASTSDVFATDNNDLEDTPTRANTTLYMNSILVQRMVPTVATRPCNLPRKRTRNRFLTATCYNHMRFKHNGPGKYCVELSSPSDSEDFSQASQLTDVALGDGAASNTGERKPWNRWSICARLDRSYCCPV